MRNHGKPHSEQDQVKGTSTCGAKLSALHVPRVGRSSPSATADLDK